MAEPERAKVYPYTGPFADVMKLLDANKLDEAVTKARGWREEDKGDLLALLALGEALERSGDLMEAGRAYGSLVDLFADRADIRRLAGARLDRLAGKTGAGSVDAARVAEDTWRRAATDRPDHPQGPRGHAWALVRLQRFAEAFDIINAARKRGLIGGRFGGVDEILNDDLGLIAAAWAKAEPTRDKAIKQRLQTETVAWPQGPSLRFVLWWETDANDVDFHIHDGKRNHAYYSTRELPTGGRLYADVTTGFGPECFTIEGKPTAYPYRLEAHYYSRGPMGFGMGAMRVMQHDGHGGIVVEDRPFIIMVDGAFVDLGTVSGPLP
jgi:tetratricopeptide (TPR) repeat protein